jgi:hypothetical protein
MTVMAVVFPEYTAPSCTVHRERLRDAGGAILIFLAIFGEFLEAR